MTGKDGSVMGVTNSRANMLCHCRTLTVACNYTEGELSLHVLHVFPTSLVHGHIFGVIR